MTRREKEKKDQDNRWGENKKENYYKTHLEGI